MRVSADCFRNCHWAIRLFGLLLGLLGLFPSCQRGRLSTYQKCFPQPQHQNNGSNIHAWFYKSDKYCTSNYHQAGQIFSYHLVLLSCRSYQILSHFGGTRHLSDCNLLHVQPASSNSLMIWGPPSSLESSAASVGSKCWTLWSLHSLPQKATQSHMSNDMANEFLAKCSNVLFLPEFGLKFSINGMLVYVSMVQWCSMSPALGDTVIKWW